MSRALQPAKVKEVLLDEDRGRATVIVHDYQLSLAIGEEGQNARLAARLTGWHIDIKSESEAAAEEAHYAEGEWAEGEWVEQSGEMVWRPAEGGETLSAEAWAAGETAEAEGETGGAERAAAAVATGLAVEALEVAEELVTETVEVAEELAVEALEVAGDLVAGAASETYDLETEPGATGELLPPPVTEPDHGHRTRAGLVASPLRTCIGCRRSAPVSELVRVVHAGEGALAVGTSLEGRGAWLCRDAPGCVDLADRRRAFSRALRRPITPEAVEQLRAELRAGSPAGPTVREPPPEQTPG